MKKQMLIPVGVSMLLAGLLALVAGGCGTDALDRRPCAEDFPCPQPAVNSCQDRNLSTDQWTSLGLDGESVTAIAAHPCNPGIIYAGTSRNFSAGVQGKLFKSTDCGQSWDTLAVGGSYRTIQFSPGNPEIIYAINGSILKSSDSGANWQRADDGIDLDAETGVASLAIILKTPARCTSAPAAFTGATCTARTTAEKAGSRFLIGKARPLPSIRRTPPPCTLDRTEMYCAAPTGGATWEPTGLKDTGSLVHALLVDPEHDGKVYAGLNREGLHVSENSGKSWKLITNAFLADTTSVVELEVDTKNGTLYVATTHGDSGRLLAHSLSSGTWKELPVPVTGKSFYYSKLKISEFEGKVYTYFGLPSGIYARIEE